MEKVGRPRLVHGFLVREDRDLDSSLSSFPKWGFGSAPLRGNSIARQVAPVLLGADGPRLTTKHSFPAVLAFPKPHFANEGILLRGFSEDGSKLSSQSIRAYLRHMSATQVIEEIQHLTPTEQAKVIQFAYRLDAERMLSGKELAAFAKRMIDASDPVEKRKIRDELTRGFYGGKPDA